MKIGKNETCPCGSGRKYKKCCSLKGAKDPVRTLTTFVKDYSAFVEQVGDFLGADEEAALKYYEEFLQEDLGNIQPVLLEVMSDPFMDWLFFSRQEGGKTLVDRYLAQDTTGEEDRKVAAALGAGIFSLYEVVQAESPWKTKIRECFSGEVFSAFMPPDEEGYEAGEVLFGRLSEFGGIKVMTGVPGLTISGIRPESLAAVKPDVIAAAGATSFTALGGAEAEIRRLMLSVYGQLFPSSDENPPLFAFDADKLENVVQELLPSLSEREQETMKDLSLDPEKGLILELKNDLGTLRLQDGLCYIDEESDDEAALDALLDDMETALEPWLVAPEEEEADDDMAEDPDSNR